MFSFSKLACLAGVVFALSGTVLSALPAQAAGQITIDFGSGNQFNHDDDNCLGRKQAARLVAKSGYEDPHYWKTSNNGELMTFFAWRGARSIWSITVDLCNHTLYEEVPAGEV